MASLPLDQPILRAGPSFGLFVQLFLSTVCSVARFWLGSCETAFSHAKALLTRHSSHRL